MTDELTLFDLPEPQRPAPISRVEQGRAGMRYARTVTADVRLRHRAALCKLAVRAFDEAPTVVIGEIDDTDDDLEGARRRLGSDWLAALRWLLDPTAGLRPLIDANAVRMPTAAIDRQPGGSTTCRVRWTVTVKLRDVTALRRVALDACPPDDAVARAEIAASLAVAWRWAVEPYAPLRDLPGITWTGVDVVVDHLPARSLG